MERETKIASANAPTIVPSLRTTLASKAATLWESRAPLLKFKTLADVDMFAEHESMFSTQTVMEGCEPSELEIMEASLTNSFLEYARSDVTKSVPPDTESEDFTEPLWRLVKKKAGVEVYKQSIDFDHRSTEIVKGMIDIHCDVARVFSVCYTGLEF